MDNWHIDEIGPFSLIEEGKHEEADVQTEKRLHCPSIDGHQYVLIITDEHTRYRIVTSLRTKDEAGDVIIETIKLFQTQCKLTLKCVTTDGGKELISKKVEQFLRSQGTTLLVAPPRTPERNGLAERMNYTHILHTRCLLAHCNAPMPLWNHASDYSAHVDNRMPRQNSGRVPTSEMLPELKVNLNNLHTFGCNVHYWTEPTERGKFQPTTKPGIFVGYSQKYNAFKVLTMPNEKGQLKVKVTLNVKFVENSFANLEAARNAINAQAEGNTPIKEGKREFEVRHIGDHKRDPKTKSLRYLVYWKGYRHPTWEPETNLSNCPEMLSKYKAETASSEQEQLLCAIEHAFISMQSASAISTLSYDRSVPNSYNEAINHRNESAQWREATHTELKSLISFGVFLEMILPTGRRPIDTRWVFAKKHNELGEIVRFKARLVARGFQQMEGIDYTETFSPTVRMKTLKIVLVIAAERDYEMIQIDFETAFLNAKMTEEIFVKPPQGYECKRPGTVLKLVKAIYGTKQASREWWIELDSFLKGLGYQSSPLDECLYYKCVDGKIMFVTVYVDDMIGFFPLSLKPIWDKDIAAIKSKYKIKELGELNWILNMSVKRDREKRLIFLSQETYIKRVLDSFGVNSNNSDKRSAKTPHYDQDATIPPVNTNPIRLTNEATSEYRSIIGSLIYAANITRPDIAFITNLLARYLNEPMNYHMKAARRILEYLFWNPSVKLTFGSGKSHMNVKLPNEPEFKVELYSDSDWAENREDRKSVGGMALTINGKLVSWQSKRQPTVALSSTEAEFHALTEAVKEGIFITQWFSHIMNQIIVPTIFEDNVGAKEMADHSTNHDKLKHIDLRLFFIRDFVKSKKVIVRQIASKENIADIFTKATKPQIFQYLKELIIHNEDPI